MLMLKIWLTTIQSIKRVRYLLLCGSIGCPHERNRLVDVVARKNQAALRLVLKIKSVLENEEFPGLVLGRPEQVARVAQQHYARPFDPLAVEYNRTSIDSWVKLACRSDRLTIDFSSGLPETETVHRVFAKDDLRKITEFYEWLIRSDLTVDHLEGIPIELAEVKAVLREFANQIKSHLSVLKIMDTSTKGLTEAVVKLRELLEKKQKSLNLETCLVDKEIGARGRTLTDVSDLQAAA